MKNYFILFVIVFSSLFSNSQSLIDTTNLWNVAHCGFGPFGESCDTYSYRLNGDTSIGQHQYKKMYSTSDTTLTYYWSLDGAMRDSGNKVYYHDFFTEYLLYDFGVSVGDTIKQISGCPDNFLIVDSVDTILIDGEPKRRLLFFFS